MAPGAAASIEEYLETSYEGLDREYRDGEIVERTMSVDAHALAQLNLGGFFRLHRQRLSLFPRTELRLRVSPARVMIPDVCVFGGRPPGERVPSTPPLIAAEIVSPDDRMSAIVEKLGEYAAWGVRHVWLIDPQLRKLFVYENSHLREVDRFELDEPHLIVEPAEIFDE